MKKSEITGILLAGGQSKRLGVNKALVEIHGKKMAEYPIRLLETFCSTILISSNQPLPFGYQQIGDVVQSQGPMVGIYSCMLQSKTPYNLVLSCDMPLLNEGLISAMIDLIDGQNIVIPVHHDDLMEPLCAIYPASCAESLGESIRQGQLTLHEFIAEHSHSKLKLSEKMSFWNDRLFENINTRADLERIK